jgi:hypothetical protein
MGLGSDQEEHGKGLYERPQGWDGDNWSRKFWEGHLMNRVP